MDWNAIDRLSARGMRSAHLSAFFDVVVSDLLSSLSVSLCIEEVRLPFYR